MIKLKDVINEVEKSWGIKEKLPIKVTIENSWNGKYLVVKVPPMKMTYDTFNYLDHNHRQQDIDVIQSQYDYSNGEATFVAASREDLDKWFKKYKKYVRE